MSGKTLGYTCACGKEHEFPSFSDWVIQGIEQSHMTITHTCACGNVNLLRVIAPGTPATTSTRPGAGEEKIG